MVLAARDNTSSTVSPSENLLIPVTLFTKPMGISGRSGYGCHSRSSQDEEVELHCDESLDVDYQLSQEEEYHFSYTGPSREGMNLRLGW